MKLQVVMDIGGEPDEIVGLLPFRDKILIATRTRLLTLEQDEETQVKITSLLDHFIPYDKW